MSVLLIAVPLANPCTFDRGRSSGMNERMVFDNLPNASQFLLLLPAHLSNVLSYVEWKWEE